MVQHFSSANQLASQCFDFLWPPDFWYVRGAPQIGGSIRETRKFNRFTFHVCIIPLDYQHLLISIDQEIRIDDGMRHKETEVTSSCSWVWDDG